MTRYLHEALKWLRSWVEEAGGFFLLGQGSICVLFLFWLDSERQWEWEAN